MDAARWADALSLFDTQPMPPEVADLVTLRRVELSLELGDYDRARYELGKPELSATHNRILVSRAAQACERVGEHRAAAEQWLRSVDLPTWTSERLLARRNAALAYAAADMPVAAAVQLAALADANARGPMVAGLEPLADLGSHHAGLVHLLNGRPQSAAAAFRAYLAIAPTGEYAVAAQRRLAALGAGPRAADSDGWNATRDLDTAGAYRAFAEVNPRSPRLPEARFREGLAYYRAGDPRTAHGVWEYWSTPDVPAEARARALYWMAKALTLLEHPTGARERWAAAAVRPATYYGTRAADRLAGAYGWPDAGAILPPPRAHRGRGGRG